MGEEKGTKSKGINVKIVIAEDYLPEVREKNPNTKSAWNDALVLLYKEHGRPLDIIIRKGESKFIVEA